MCGLVGGYGWANEIDANRAVVAASHQLLHRGPDGHGVSFGEVGDLWWGLGHQRLAVIDLDDDAHQPMWSRDGRFGLVFNGEIYNYRELRLELSRRGKQFQTDSDTEVLLQAWSEWGPTALPRFTGMFAFAIVDSLTNVITCARDAFGIKPLHYVRRGREYYFASEISALQTVSKFSGEVNLQAAYDFLAYGQYDTNEHTFFRGIQRLRPGHYLEVNMLSGEESLVKWWAPKLEPSSLSFEDAARELRRRLIESVKLHLRSDVPVGLALSGGIDSSSLACIARLVEPDLPLTAFTFAPSDANDSEAKWAKIVSDEIRLPVQEVRIGSRVLPGEIDEFIMTQGEPVSSLAPWSQFKLFQAVREAGVTVLLEGQGADELFAGYHGFVEARLLSIMRSGNLLEASRLLTKWREWPGRSRRTALRAVASQATKDSVKHLVKRYVQRSGAIDFQMARECGVDIVPTKSFTKVTERMLVSKLIDSTDRFLLPPLLRQGDRSAMHWSVENRTPFLNPSIAEFAWSLDEDYLLSGKGETKAILRSAMRGLVPDEILDRRDKMGFVSPERLWVTGMSDWVNQGLEGLSDIPFLRLDAIRTLAEGLDSGQAPYRGDVWRFACMGRWAQLLEVG